MSFHSLTEARERYVQQELPQLLRTLARACWKTGVKPSLGIATFFLEKMKRFDFPKECEGKLEWKLDMLLGLYEKETVALCTQIIRPTMMVLDVGAHVGYLTRLFAKLVGPGGHVYAFEPHPGNFSLLKKNTSHFTNVTALNKALSHEKGTGRLFISTKSGCHSLHSQNHSVLSVPVDLVVLDHFWEELGRPRIDFIKMDIEGAEPRVLEGAKKLIAQQKRLMLISEFSPANLIAGGTRPEEFLSLLSSLGLRWAAIGTNGSLLSTIPTIRGDHYVNLLCEKDT